MSAPPPCTAEAAASLLDQAELAWRLRRKGKHTCRCLNGAPAAETSKHLECRLGTVQCRPGRQLSTSIEFPYRHDIGQILPDGVAVRKIYRGQTFRGLGHDVTFPNGNPPKIRPCNKILLSAPPLYTEEAAASLIHQANLAWRLRRKGKHTLTQVPGWNASSNDEHAP